MKKRYEVDFELSRKIRIDGKGAGYILDIIRTIMFGNSLLGNNEYIEKEGLTESDIEEINELVDCAKEAYIEILHNIEGNDNKKAEDLKEANKMARFLSFDENGTIGFVVLKNIFVSSDEELIKFVNVESEFVDVDDKLYFEI